VFSSAGIRPGSVLGEKAGVQAVHATFECSDEFFSTISG
jgi:hypothetical protein